MQNGFTIIPSSTQEKRESKSSDESTSDQSDSSEQHSTNETEESTESTSNELEGSTESTSDEPQPQPRRSERSNKGIPPN